MSADNWRVCPRCTEGQQSDLAAAEAELQAVYGVLSQGDYESLKQTVEAIKTRYDLTLREDYSVGLWDAGFSFSYSCSCDDCGFSWHRTLDVPLAQVMEEAS